MPHHLRAHEWCRYREGVTVAGVQQTAQGSEEGERKGRRKSEPDAGASTMLVDAGLPHTIAIPASIPPNTRVTLKFPESTGSSDIHSGGLIAKAVAPSAPREEAGYYWGYSVRPASSLSDVFTESPYDGGYDLTIGTSERGVPISTLTHREGPNDEPRFPEFNHLLIAFGGVAGLEVAVRFDEELKGMGVTDPERLFDYWVDLCPGQGSRTIRTEEAVWLGLMGLRDVVRAKGSGRM